MTTQDKEAVEATEKVEHECPACGLLTEIPMIASLNFKRLPCVRCSEEYVYDEPKQREKPVIGEDLED